MSDAETAAVVCVNSIMIWSKTNNKTVQLCCLAIDVHGVDIKVVIMDGGGEDGELYETNLIRSTTLEVNKLTRLYSLLKLFDRAVNTAGRGGGGGFLWPNVIFVHGHYVLHIGGDVDEVYGIIQ